MAAALPLLPPPAHAAERERRQRRRVWGKAPRCISFSRSSCPLYALPVRAAAGGRVTAETVGRRCRVAFLVGSLQREREKGRGEEDTRTQERRTRGQQTTHR